MTGPVFRIGASNEYGMSKATLRNLNATPRTVKSGATNLYGIQIENNQAADAWVQLFDKSSPTLGTDVPDKEFRVAANGSLRHSFEPEGVQFNIALVLASTTTEAGAVGSAAGVQVFIDYA